MLDLTMAPESLRREVRAWLEDSVPLDWRVTLAKADGDDWQEFHRSWFARLRAVGLHVPHLPLEWGGGAPFAQQVVIQEEFAHADAPDPRLFAISLNHVPATLLEFGSQEQIQRHLPAALEGTVWCQGFSEPEAGSDLASLRTSAVTAGDNFVVNGQKVWSSLAQFADWCLLLVRTDPAAPKRHGISYLLMDMHSPGVQVRPIRQMTGDSEFCEIFLDDVVIPRANMVGVENQGWSVTQSTLAAERGPITLGFAIRLTRTFDLILQSMTRGEHDKHLDRNTRRQVARLWAQVQGIQALCYRMVEALARGEDVGAGAAVVKLYFSELVQQMTELGVTTEGIEAHYDRPHPAGDITQTGLWMIDYLNSWMWTISGGSNQVLRTMVGDRVLQLPRDPGMA